MQRDSCRLCSEQKPCALKPVCGAYVRGRTGICFLSHKSVSSESHHSLSSGMWYLVAQVHSCSFQSFFHTAARGPRDCLKCPIISCDCSEPFSGFCWSQDKHKTLPRAHSVVLKHLPSHSPQPQLVCTLQVDLHSSFHHRSAHMLVSLWVEVHWAPRV